MLKNTSKSILVLVTYPLIDPASRFRILQYIPDLPSNYNITVNTIFSKNFYSIKNKKGIKWTLVKILAMSFFLIKRIYFVFFMKKVDLIFIQREVFPFFTPLFERIIRSKTSKLVFDFDDAIFLKPEGWKNWRDYLRKPNRVSEIISLADTVIAGNKYLKEYSLKFNNSCLVLPTVHKRDKSEKPSHIDNKIVVLGWIGNWTTLRNLFLIQSELEDLSKDIPFEIKLFGASNIYQFKLNSASVKYEMWSLEREEAFLSEIDIGIMPLYNTPWEKGKCGFKLIQYMTFSKPVIGSKVGVNEEIIDHGKNGYLCESSKDWKYAIEELVQDNNKRKQFGEQSYKIVQDRYSYAKNLKVIRSIIDGSI